jgi:uncharacterized protein
MNVRLSLLSMFDGVIGFDWDEGNLVKCQKHGVSIEEIEALFLLNELNVLVDDVNSKHEQRFRAIGRVPAGRYIFLGFTFRKFDGDILIRVFTARYMHKKEIQHYAQKNSHYEN